MTAGPRLSWHIVFSVYTVETVAQTFKLTNMVVGKLRIHLSLADNPQCTISQVRYVLNNHIEKVSMLYEALSLFLQHGDFCSHLSCGLVVQLNLSFQESMLCRIDQY